MSDTIVMDVLQAEHRQWLQTMYPEQTREIPAAGMVEEAAELLHAVLKMEQTRRWGADPRHGDLKAKLLDALGDCVIIACSYCSSANMRFEGLWAHATHGWEGGTMELSVLLVKEAAEHFGSFQYMCLVKYIELVKSIARMYDINIDDATAVTWRSVKERKR